MIEKIRIKGITDVGNVRPNNEDAFFIDEEAGLMIVSDGMGGQQAGEVASRIAIEALPGQVAAARMTGGIGGVDSGAELLVQAIGVLGELMFEKSQEHPTLAGMGATIVACLVVEGSLAIAHLGDSRAYLLRGNSLERLTEDHTVAELLRQAGAITKGKVKNHLARHVLRKYLGMENCPPADAGILKLEPGDRILLCTDGLTGMVDDRGIGQLLLDEPDTQKACERLVELAKEAGGEDNITVVIADFDNASRNGKRQAKVIVKSKTGRSLLQPLRGGQSEVEKANNLENFEEDENE